MKLCQVMASRGEGGLERHFSDLCNSLAGRHQVIAIAHPEFRSRLDSQVIFEPLDMSGWRYQPSALMRLYAALRRHRPDLIHAQANKAATMIQALRWSLRAKRVATVHNLKHNTRMFQSFDALIAVSKQVAAQLPHPRVSVIYNGINPPTLPENSASDYLRVALGVATSTPVVISVGRLVPAKGFDKLLQAWTGIDATLTIVGDGPERSRLENQIKNLKLTERVILAGYRRDVPTLMAGADLMVIASRNEGFPYVLVEGLHVRQLIIATRVPGALDVLPAEFLVDYGDSHGLAEAIRAVLRDPGAAQRVFKPAWEFAARELTLQRMTEKTEQVYQQVLSMP